MKKVLALLLVSMMILAAFAGCSQEDAPPASTPESTPATDAPADDGGEESTPAAGGGIAKEDIKIGAVFYGTSDDGGWSQSHYSAFLRTKEEMGLTDDQMILMENVPDQGPEPENVLEQMITEGCNMLFGTSTGHGDAIYNTAARHPDLFFHQFEGMRDEPNASAYSVRDYEAIFMVGWLAGKMSEGNELGFVAAQPQASVVRAINSWAKGAQYANPDAKVKVVWINSWFDPAADKEAANALIDEGKTVLGYHGSSSSVMQAAGEAGVYATGFHIDMHDFAPEAVITSFVWNWTPIYNQYVENAIAGTWSKDTMFLGLDAGCATYAPFNDAIVPAEVIEEAKAVEADLKSGAIEVFPTPVLDNQGTEIVPEGGAFTDEELINMMFLIDNVIGSM